MPFLSEKNLPKKKSRLILIPQDLLRDMLVAIGALQRMRVTGGGKFEYADSGPVLSLPPAQAIGPKLEAIAARANANGESAANDVAYPGMIETPAEKSYTIDQRTIARLRIKSLTTKTSAGSAVVSIRVDGVTIASIAATTDENHIDIPDGYASAGSTISLAISGLSSATDLAFTLVAEENL